MNTLFLLPGFLGRPSDFDSLKTILNERAPRLNVQVFDWLEAGEDLLGSSLDQVGAVLGKNLQKLGLKNGDCVLGYSLGGRLALSLREHASQNDLDLQFVFLSANPGLASDTEKAARRIADEKWAVRFETENFEKVIEDWNAQGVFQRSKKEPVRFSEDYRKSDLSRILRLWSLSEQKDHRESLMKGSQNFLWLTGALDEKFVNLARGLPRHKDIPGASHRVHIDAPAELAHAIISYINSGEVG